MESQASTQPVKPRQGRFDLAYGAYLFLGTVALWTARVVFPGPPAPGTGGYDAFISGLGFFVAIPFGLPVIVALLVVCWLSMQLSRDTWLIGLFLVTFAFSAYMIAWWYREWFHWFPLFLYGAVCTVSGLWWFVWRRWRLLQGPASEAADVSSELNGPC